MAAEARLGQGVDVILDTDVQAPHCAHGPTLLFARYSNGRCKRFFSCSACRDRKSCSFFQSADDKSTKRVEEKQNHYLDLQKTPHTKLKYQKRLKRIKALETVKRCLCRECGTLLLPEEINSHAGHKLLTGLTTDQLSCPTRLLAPLDNNKTNAQYLFSDKTLTFLVESIKRQGFTKVLCVGVPRLHEELDHIRKSTAIRSLLVDIDQRLEQFYPNQQFCRYNMFNHYFFRGETDRAVYQSFLSCGEGDSLVVVLDPPFGGLVEVLAHTVDRIKKDYQAVNGNEESVNVKFMWVFPYFLEARILQALPRFNMLDYKVDYDNHSVFDSEKKSSKNGSPVRIFTDIKPADVQLPEDQYRFCAVCERYVANETKHCSSCKACTSKDGQIYVHCDFCRRCVKPNWKHCEKCHKCHLPSFQCHQPQVGCHLCGDTSHKRKDCPQNCAEGASKLKRKTKKETGWQHKKKRKL